MFLDYQRLILKTYKQKRAEGTLSTNLTNPTPAKLKDECRIVCTKRYQRKDEKILWEFFEEGTDQANFLKAIKKYETDKFKPLVHFLRESTSSSEEKNINLLAWLIDLDDRPFEFGKDYSGRKSPGPEKVPIAGTDDKNGNAPSEETAQSGDEMGTAGGKQVVPKLLLWSLRRNTIIAIVLVLSAGLGAYWLWPGKTPLAMTMRYEKCMCWSGDHYEPVPCNKKGGDTLVIALDSARQNDFRRITQPDTITFQSIGRVWYIKLNRNIEYYTASGSHPTYPHLRVRPITVYIIEKYIINKQKTE